MYMRAMSVFPVALFAVVCLVTSVSVAEADDLDPSGIKWSSLSMRARKMGVTFRSNVTIGLVDSKEESSQFFSRPDGQGLQPRGAELVLTTLGGRGMGTQSMIHLWTEPGDGVSLQRTELQGGRRDRFRVHRNESAGVYSIRRAPKGGEEDRPHDQWSEVSDTINSFPDWAGEGMEVSDPTALFYFLAVAKLDQVGDMVQFPVFSRDKLLLVDLKVTGRERTRVNFVKKTGGRSEEVGGQQELITLVIDGSHLGPDSVEGDFEFMGLRGDVDVLLHPELRAPVEVAGRVPRAGRVRLRLREIEVR